MSDINLQWNMYLCDDAKFPFLDRNLIRLTKWFVDKNYDEFKNIWEDIYHDMVIKVIQKKNDIITNQFLPLKNFKAWYCRVIRNYLIDKQRKTIREKSKLLKYQSIVETELKEPDMNEQEILLKFTNIMLLQNNKTHVEIFIDFVKGSSYSEIAGKHDISKENARKIIERMRRVCRSLWESDRIKIFKSYINETTNEARVLFGKQKEEAIKSLIQKLIGELPEEYKENIIKQLRG